MDLTKQLGEEFLKKIILEGSPEEKRELYGFDFNTPRKIIKKKFKLFARGCYPRFFQSRSAVLHDDIIDDMIASYFGVNKVCAAFRGSAKTSLKKLYDVFILLNDRGEYRKYIKVLSRDFKNSRQIVTDIYNMIVEVRDVYGNVFEKEKDVKREETMSGFTMMNGRKYSAGTVGQSQRGHIQDAYRPDWIWFEDIEDRESIRSAIITEGVIIRCGEALDGLSVDGSWYLTCNYISDQGTVEWFMQRGDKLIVPIRENGKPTWPERYNEEKIKQLEKDSDDFWGEYMCDPRKSQGRFFNLDIIEQQMKNCREPIRESSGVKYWANYQPHHRYAQGSDHSEGVKLDANTLVGMDFTTGEVVYTYYNNEIGPDLSAHEFARVGAEFGNCLWAPEVNNKCGGTVITTIKQINYPNVYQYLDDMRIGQLRPTKWGWETNRKTKYNMFFDFKKDFNDGLIKIYDKNILKEMMAYSNSDLQDEKAGLVTRHFDLLTATVIVNQMKKHAQSTKNNYNENYKKYIESLKK